MHIGKQEILTRGGRGLKVIPGKALKNRVQGRLTEHRREVNEHESAGNDITLTWLFNYAFELEHARLISDPPIKNSDDKKIVHEELEYKIIDKYDIKHLKIKEKKDRENP